MPCLILIASHRQFRFLFVVLFVAVSLSFLRLSAIVGLLQVHRIATGSMAPSLLGAHYRCECGDCGFSFVCDAGKIPENRVVVCPNCSNQQIVEDSETIRGQRVVIDRWPYRFDSPKRWDAIAFQQLDDPIEVKRIIGLPDESIELRDGDLWIDGRIVQKSYKQFRESAVLVHDNAFQPQTDLPARWYGAPTGAQPFTFLVGGGAELQYRSWLPVLDATPPIGRTQQHPIVDVNTYNQAASRSRFFECRDLMMEFTVDARPYTTLTVEFRQFAFPITLELRSRSITVKSKNKTGWRPTNRGTLQLSIALCDLRILIAVNNDVTFVEDISPRVLREEFKNEQLPRILFDRPVTIGRLKLYRDIYLLGPYGHNRWKAPASDGYFVMGDNVAQSHDSRFGQRIPRESILGKAKPFGR